MKTIIKILIPIILLIGIVLLIGFTQSSIEDFKSNYAFKPFDFESHVSQITTDSIKNQPLGYAHRKYNELYNSIMIESKVTTIHHDGSSSPLIESEKAQHCFETAFNSYFSVFKDWADKIFSGNQWENIDLETIKNESQRLKTKRGVGNNVEQIDKYVQYVAGHKEACDAIRWASSCNNENTYNTIVNRATKYSVYPYKNCSRLKDLREAPSIARKSWEKSIENYVNNICARHYDNYNDYKYSVGDPRDRIRAYRKSTNQSNWGKPLMEKIDNYEYELKQKKNQMPVSY